MTTNKTFTLEIKPDLCPINPREDFDNLGTMACWHSNHILGDEQPQGHPTETISRFPRGTIHLPLYLYDHSGLSMSTSPFNCPWDSGQVGFIYATPDTIRREYGDLGDCAIEQAFKVLQSEVETYNAYLQGDIHGWVILDGDANTVDSCWGYYDAQDAASDGAEALATIQTTRRDSRHPSYIEHLRIAASSAACGLDETGEYESQLESVYAYRVNLIDTLIENGEPGIRVSQALVAYDALTQPALVAYDALTQ